MVRVLLPSSSDVRGSDPTQRAHDKLRFGLSLTGIAMITVGVILLASSIASTIHETINYGWDGFDRPDLLLIGAVLALVGALLMLRVSRLRGQKEV